MHATCTAATLVLAATAGASASVTVTTSYNDWQAAAGPQITQLTFQGIGGGGFHDQYASYGVSDPEPNDIITFSGGQWTLQSESWSPNTITFAFAIPVFAVGWTALHSQTATLYLGGNVVASSVFIPGGPPGAGWTFSGLASDIAFDKVVIAPIPLGNAAGVDDLWFPTIPAPPAAAVAVIAILASRRRRR